MIRTLRNLGVAAVGPLVLAGCGGGDGTSSTAAPPSAPPTASFESHFGATFAADFDAASAATPPHPAASDVPAVNLTAEPLDN